MSDLIAESGKKYIIVNGAADRRSIIYDGIFSADL